MPQIEIKNLSKSFGDHLVLSNISYEFKDKRMTAIVGNSGTGKSTLLNLIGLLDKPDNGEVILFEEINVRPHSKAAKKILREKIGYLFQNYALVDEKSVAYNLEIVLPNEKKNRKALIEKVLKKVDLTGFENKSVSACSGGEQQRIAIARLLLKPCEVILADEPTGSLDADNKAIVIQLLKQLNQEGKTIILVTHDPEIVEICDERLYLSKK